MIDFRRYVGTGLGRRPKGLANNSFLVHNSLLTGIFDKKELLGRQFLSTVQFPNISQGNHVKKRIIG